MEYGVSRIPVRFAVQKLSGEDWLVPDDRRRLRVKNITRKSIEDIYSFREIMETRSLQKIFEDDRNKDYDTAYFYLKRDHFDHSISGRSVADLVDQRLQTLRAAEKIQEKVKNSAEPLVRHCFFSLTEFAVRKPQKDPIRFLRRARRKKLFARSRSVAALPQAAGQGADASKRQRLFEA